MPLRRRHGRVEKQDRRTQAQTTQYDQHIRHILTRHTDAKNTIPNTADKKAIRRSDKEVMDSIADKEDVVMRRSRGGGDPDEGRRGGGGDSTWDHSVIEVAKQTFLQTCSRPDLRALDVPGRLHLTLGLGALRGEGLRLVYCWREAEWLVGVGGDGGGRSCGGRTAGRARGFCGGGGSVARRWGGSGNGGGSGSHLVRLY